MSELLNVCLTRNECGLLVQGAAPCGRAKSHLPPDALPGTQCPSALYGRYEEVIDPPPQKNLHPHSRAIIAGSLMLELSMSPKVSIAEALTYFAKAQEHFEQPVNDPATPYPIYAKCRQGLVFLPAYKAYKYGCQLSPGPRSEQRSGISLLMTDIREAPSEPQQKTNNSDPTPPLLKSDMQKGILTKLALLGALIDTGLDVLPPLDRRDQDGFIVTGNSLIPLKVTNSHPSSNPITKPNVISFQDLVYNANHHSGRKLLPGTIGTITGQVVRRLEHNGYSPFGPPQTDTDYLIQRITADLRDHFQNQIAVRTV